MSNATIGLIGFYNFMNMRNDDLFKYLDLPDGIDKQTLVNNILYHGGEFETLHADPYFIQNAIAWWSTKWTRTFERWINALNIEYNPLENYDRIESWNDSGNAVGSDSSSSSGSVNNKVSAFNSNEMQDDTATSSNAYGSSSSSASTNNSHDGRIHGNVGVTTSQQMLESELSIAKWNIYEHITDIFLSEFVLPLY